MRIVEQLETIPLSQFSVLYKQETGHDWIYSDLIIRFNPDNAFYCFENLVFQVDDVDVWRWIVEDINADAISSALETKAQEWQNNSDAGRHIDFEPCQWFTDIFMRTCQNTPSHAAGMNGIL